MSNPSVFEVASVSFRYRDVTALDNLSIRIPAGERVALIGANGSGKSTLLRVLAGLSFPAQGSVSVFGETLSADRLEQEDFFYRFRRRVAVLFQNPDVQLFNPSVFDEVAFGPLQLRWPRDQIRSAVENALRLLGIENLRDRAPHRLSGGEKKRVALASILVLDPEVLLLDEPTAALDPNSESQILQLLSGWQGSGKTVVIATHDLETLETIADRCYVLSAGRIAGEGPPFNVLHDLRLLADARLLRLQHHRHPAAAEVEAHPHPHLHEGDLT